MKKKNISFIYKLYKSWGPRLLAGSPSGLLDFVSATLSISMSATTFHLHVHHHIIKLVGHIVNLNVLHQHNTTST